MLHFSVGQDPIKILASLQAIENEIKPQGASDRAIVTIMVAYLHQQKNASLSVMTVSHRSQNPLIKTAVTSWKKQVLDESSKEDPSSKRMLEWLNSATEEQIIAMSRY